MIGPYLVLTFRWPWGLCWQLLVNFLHWGHSLTFYLSANYLTFSTYHLLFFKLLEAHPHFDTFLGKYSFFLPAAEMSLCQPAVISLLLKKLIACLTPGWKSTEVLKIMKLPFNLGRQSVYIIKSKWYLNKPRSLLNCIYGNWKKLLYVGYIVDFLFCFCVRILCIYH